ncbi:MAG: ferredoxin [Actinomycetota bacterium]|nr:ferredoxin [Actinomycetota bacterium]
MEIRVDRTLCEANGVCVGLAPDTFELDDDEQLIIRPAKQSPDWVEHVSLAVARCPKNALQMLS